MAVKTLLTPIAVISLCYYVTCMSYSAYSITSVNLLPCLNPNFFHMSIHAMYSVSMIYLYIIAITSHRLFIIAVAIYSELCTCISHSPCCLSIYRSSLRCHYVQRSMSPSSYISSTCSAITWHRILPCICLSLT